MTARANGAPMPHVRARATTRSGSKSGLASSSSMSRSVIKRAGTSAAPAVSGMEIRVGEIEHPHRAATDDDVAPSVEQLGDRDSLAQRAGDERAVEIEADAAEGHGNVLGEPAVVARPHLGVPGRADAA